MVDQLEAALQEGLVRLDENGNLRVCCSSSQVVVVVAVVLVSEVVVLVVVVVVRGGEGSRRKEEEGTRREATRGRQGGGVSIPVCLACRKQRPLKGRAKAMRCT